MLEAALAYAAKGWPVVPLHTPIDDGGCSCRDQTCGSSVGKHPRTKHGFKQATTDEAQIRAWWGMWPEANIGIPTGPRSGVWILDIDRDKGGFLSLEDLVMEHGLLPDTRKGRTGGGGEHQVYRWRSDREVRNKQVFAPGLDTRGDGGYFVAPPSLHRSGARYEWADEDAEVLDAPEWLIDRVTAQKHAPQPSKTREPVRNPRAYGEAALRGACADIKASADGAKNDTINRVAFALREIIERGFVKRSKVEEELQLAAEERDARSEKPDGASQLRKTIKSGLGDVQDPEHEQAQRSTADESEVIEDKDGAPWGSDEALALDFAARCIDRFRFCAQDSAWREWDGTRWTRDDALHHFTEARALVRGKAREADNPNDAKRLASAKCVGATVQLARSDQRLVITADAFDADEWLLNTPAGTVDLRTGELRSARREDYLTMRTATTPGGDCPRWRSALEDWTGSDQELVAFLKRMAGYALTGSTREHALFFFWGLGGNGKSVFIKTLAAVLGDYARTAPIETFTESPHDRHPTELAMLRNARLVESQETEEGRAWAEAKLKRLTGGDRIAARFMRGDFFEYTPIFKLFVFGNHKPRLRNVDAAMRRRLHLIPFNVPVSEEKKDKMLSERLRDEWGGILRWAIDGALEWQRIGLSPPKAVSDASANYFEGEDLFGQWFEETCVKDDTLGPVGKLAWAQTSHLVSSFAAWAAKRGSKPLSQKALIEKLEALGFERTKRENGKRGVAGLRLRTTAAGAAESQEGADEDPGRTDYA